MHHIPKGEAERRSRGLLRRLGFLSLKKEETALKLGALEGAARAKPSLLDKLSVWVGQLARLKRKEMDIISQLDAVERKHALLRKEKRLRKAKPASVQKPVFEDEPENKEGFWFWVLALAFFFRKKNPPDAPKNG